MRAYSNNIALAAILLAPLARARYVCHHEEIVGAYPYCISIPDSRQTQENYDTAYPTILYLPGSGSFGPVNEIEALSTYDGVGRLLDQYRKGDKTEAGKMASERFVTIIPIAPKEKPDGTVNKHYRPEYIDKVVTSAISQYPIDLTRVYTVGYSAGCRGTVRYNVFRPFWSTAAVCVAGGAEKAGAQYLEADPQPETFSHLDRMTNLPIKIVGGTGDTTAPVEPKDTYDELVRLGSKKAVLTMMEDDHEGLQRDPWSTELLKWLLDQRRGEETKQYRRSGKERLSDEDEDEESEYALVQRGEEDAENEDDEVVSD